MINPQWLELLMSRTIFYGPKDVRAIEVRLYFYIQWRYMTIWKVHFLVITLNKPVFLNKNIDICPYFATKYRLLWVLIRSVSMLQMSSHSIFVEKYLVRLSLLTMTNPNQLCDVLLFVCSKMADETNLSSKLPVADRTREVWGRKLCWWCLSSGFLLCTFLLGFADSFCFVFTSSPFYEASPLCTILCNLFPWLCWYAEVFKGGFEGVLISLPLTTMGALSYLFSIEDFLWQTFIRHSGNMACPS